MNDNGLRTWLGIVVIILSFGLLTCEEATLLDDLANQGNGTGGSGFPVSSGGVTVSYTYFDNNPPIFAADVTWEAATDDATAQSQLVYQAYHSSAANIGSVDEAIANGTAILAAPSEGAVSAYQNFLTQDTTYYFNVVVTDEDDNSVDYGMVSAATGTGPVLTVLDTYPDPYVQIESLGTLDFGVVSYSSYGDQSTAARRDIRIRNDGDYPLSITDASTSPSGSWTALPTPNPDMFYFYVYFSSLPEAIDPGNWTEITVMIYNGFTNDSVSGSISLTTDASNYDGDFVFDLVADLTSN